MIQTKDIPEASFTEIGHKPIDISFNELSKEERSVEVKQISCCRRSIIFGSIYAFISTLGFEYGANDFILVKSCSRFERGGDIPEDLKYNTKITIGQIDVESTKVKFDWINNGKSVLSISINKI